MLTLTAGIEVIQAQSMRLSRLNLRNTFSYAGLVIAIGLAGCSNTCFVGSVNNGNASVRVKAGDPPPSCPLAQTNGAIRVVALKSPVCETCATAARAEHLFVAVRSIQLRPDALNEPNLANWLEIAEQMANQPRQIDLMGNATLAILVENAVVPAGTYGEVRLQFFAEFPSNAETLLPENACGDWGWNCMVMADGHIEPIRFSGDTPELRVALHGAGGDSFALLPDARTDLQLRLEPRQLLYVSSTGAWKPQTVLVGQAAVMPE